MHPPSSLLCLLRHFDTPACDCPLYLTCPCGQECGKPDCPHCLEICSCPPKLFQPPCRHTLTDAPPDVLIRLRDWFALRYGRLADDVDCLAALCAALNPEEYLDPAAPAPDLLTQKRRERIKVMRKRQLSHFAVRHPWDRWRKQERPEAAVVISRGMNGAINEEGLRYA